MDDLLKDFSTTRCVFWTATKLEETSIESLKAFMLKRYSWVAQVEHGKNGSNEHLHFMMINGPKETYNARNTLKKVLFPEDVKRGVVIDERRLKAVTITNSYAFLYYCGYMLKESQSFMYKSDDLPTLSDINESLKKYEKQIAEAMEGFSQLSTRKEQHAASSCARYRILCEKYKLALTEFADLFHALEADGIDTQWMLKDKYLLYEYISFKTQRIEFLRNRVKSQMNQQGLIEYKPPKEAFPSTKVNTYDMDGRNLRKESPDIFSTPNNITEDHGKNPSKIQRIQSPSESSSSYFTSEIDETQIFGQLPPRITQSVPHKAVVRI